MIRLLTIDRDRERAQRLAETLCDLLTRTELPAKAARTCPETPARLAAVCE